MSASMTACSDCTAFSVSSFAIAVSCLTLVTLLAVPTLYTSASFLRASTASATSLFVWPSILVISISASFFLIRMSCIVMSSIASTRLFCGNSPRSCRSASVAKPVSSSFITLVEHPPPQRRLSATFSFISASMLVRLAQNSSNPRCAATSRSVDRAWFVKKWCHPLLSSSVSGWPKLCRMASAFFGFSRYWKDTSRSMIWPSFVRTVTGPSMRLVMEPTT